MKNCVITKFNESTNNSDYPVIGQMNIRIVAGSSLGIRPLPNKTIHMSSSGDLYTEAEGGTNMGRDFDLDSSKYHHLFNHSNVEQTVKVTSKYDVLICNDTVEDYSDLMYNGTNALIKNFGSSTFANLDTLKEYGHANKLLTIYNDTLAPGAILDIPIWKHSGNMSNMVYTDINLGSGKARLILGASSDTRGVEGSTGWLRNATQNWKQYTMGVYAGLTSSDKVSANVEDFEEYVNMMDFDMKYNSVTGNLATGFGHATSIRYIDVSKHEQAEDLSSLLNALYTNGKVDGTLQIFAGSNKTLNGNPWVNGTIVTFTNSGWVIN
jgi:hypothetical protein